MSFERYFSFEKFKSFMIARMKHVKSISESRAELILPKDDFPRYLRRSVPHQDMELIQPREWYGAG